MTLLQMASSQLASRPDEEHFPDFASLLADARASRDQSTDIHVDDERVLFTESGVDVGLPDNAVLTRYALEQAAILSGVPVNVLPKLSRKTAAQVLNETFPRDHNGEDARRWLVRNRDGQINVRAVLTQQYRRIWDAEVLEAVERWILADSVGWTPAMPEINTDTEGTNIKGNRKPALFRSDRDSFAFFMSPRESDGGDFGGLRRGVYVYNSEVGARSFGFSTFYFRGMCANFLIWDATQVKERKVRHVGEARLAFDELVQYLKEQSPVLSDAELQRFRKAQATPFRLAPATTATETWEDRAELKLRGTYKLTEAQAHGAVESMTLPENEGTNAGSIWAVVNGLTSYSKRLSFAGDRTTVQKVAGQVMERELALAGV